MICVPIMASSTEEGLELMERAFAEADLVEIRADAFEEIDLERLTAAAVGPLLVTNRSHHEGGCFRGSEEEGMRLIFDAVDLGVDYVDCEIRTAPPLLGALAKRISERGGKTKAIFSFHCFENTPPEVRLRRMVNEAFDLGCDVAKIVTTATSMEDNLRMFNFIHWAVERHRPIIAFCMGELGKVSRLAAPLFGSLLTFASLEEGRETASGQIAVREMKRALELIMP